ncbi:10898_t:CDS:1 [Dentiscutata erythropus]|uniref:10898_t:CDS:1 n=1 Tax=Dentiscutata erythropus TaxID=1348616 RepID=A0A9N9P3M8_9GLOM|nr:10898_t:CDS:1 [Dentiscutata erythropus]
MVNAQPRVDLTKIVNAQASVDQEYPQETRKRIICLDISNKNLEGSLKLEGFSNLEVLNCSNNLLTDVDFSDLDPEKIKEINLKNNQLSIRDLTCFSKFVNIQRISVDSSFHGSLEPLKSLTKLRSITIAGTHINSGLKYLPISVNSTGFFDREWNSFTSLITSCENFGCHKVLKRLEQYILLTTVYDPIYHDPKYCEKDVLEAWRIENILEYRQKKKEKLVKNKFLSLKSQLFKLEIIFEQQIKPLEFKNLIPQIKKKKAEIINILHSGRGTSAYLHNEIKKMRKKLSDNKKLEQHLQEAKKITIDLEKARFFHREDKKEVYKGAYRDLKRLEKNLSYHKKLEHNMNYYEIALRGFVHGTILVELIKHIVEIQKLTQKLLGRRYQFQIL